MSSPIDISQNTESNKDTAQGGMSRFIFTLAITTAICLSILTFLWILGRTTGEENAGLNVATRNSAQIYVDAASIPEKPLRVRALKNFSTAYPDAPEVSRAQTMIQELEGDEHEKWLSLSDIFYTTTTPLDDKKLAVDAFQNEWGTGTYREELSVMLEQLEQEPVRSAPPRQTAAVTEPLAPDQAEALDESMAGGPPKIEIYKPAALLPPPAAEPVVVAAKIIEDEIPDYPSRARTRNIEAVVFVAMDIDASGKVKDAYIVRPATGRYANDFGRAAIRAAKKTRFSPKTVDGVPEPTNGFTRRYRFEIADE